MCSFSELDHFHVLSVCVCAACISFCLGTRRIYLSDGTWWQISMWCIQAFENSASKYIYIYLCIFIYQKRFSMPEMCLGTMSECTTFWYFSAPIILRLLMRIKWVERLFILSVPDDAGVQTTQDETKMLIGRPCTQWTKVKKLVIHAIGAHIHFEECEHFNGPIDVHKNPICTLSKPINCATDTIQLTALLFLFLLMNLWF